MPVINTDAARRADAIVEESKADWLKAYKISLLKTKEERIEALEEVALETDTDYANEIRAKAITCFVNRRDKAEAALDKASKRFKKGMRVAT